MKEKELLYKLNEWLNLARVNIRAWAIIRNLKKKTRKTVSGPTDGPLRKKNTAGTTSTLSSPAADPPLLSTPWYMALASSPTAPQSFHLWGSKEAAFVPFKCWDPSPAHSLSSSGADPVLFPPILPLAVAGRRVSHPGSPVRHESDVGDSFSFG